MRKRSGICSLRKKEVLLGNIQDLDFEYKCGKLSETDYEQVRKEMTGEVAGVLEHIHGIEASLDLDALIRREITARKNPSAKSALAGLSLLRCQQSTQKQVLCGMRRKNKPITHEQRMALRRSFDRLLCSLAADGAGPG